MKKLIYRIFSVFAVPALIIHELSHIVSLIFTLHTFRKINIITNPDDWSIRVSINRLPGRNLLEEFIISMSPFFVSLVVMGVCSVYCPYVIIYMLITSYVLIPSSEDFDNLLNYKKYV